MADRFASTIDALTSGLKPVRRLAPAWVLALGFFACAAVLAGAVYAALGHDIGGITGRPWVLPGLVGSLLTAVLAAYAAFQISRPDRPDMWALLPAPAALLWVVSLVVGCIVGADDPATWGAGFTEVKQCLTIILGASIPLSALVIVMLRRAKPQRWLGVSLMGGLASAAAAGSVLILVSPHNSSVLDVVVHTVCVLAVVSLTGAVGGRVLRREA